MMKLLLDMNLSPRWVEFLETRGFETIHWSNIGSLDAADTEIMAFAAEKGYVVLTHDLDFGAILAATRDQKPSVVQIRSDNLGIDEIGECVAAALNQMATDLANGVLMTLDTKRIRLRILPLNRN